MPAYVIDTNVGIVANGKNCPQADNACIRACIAKLRECVGILKSENIGWIVIDNNNEIMDEYKKHLSFSGQPGVGDMFFKELFQRQMSDRCERVIIHKEVSRGYEEFPDTPDLENFDLSDRKFVAVARASRNTPIVVNAVDSDWYHYEARLQEYNVRVEQLCPNCLERNNPQ